MRTVYLIALLSLFSLCLPSFALAKKVSREYPAGRIDLRLRVRQNAAKGFPSTARLTVRDCSPYAGRSTVP